MGDFPKAQVSTFLGEGGQIVARSDDPDEAVDLFKTMAKRGDEIIDVMVVLANQAKLKGLKANESSSPSSSGTSKASSRPPSSSNAGECDHGVPWNDCKGKTTRAGAKYRNRYYCVGTKERDDQCKPWGDND